VVIDNKSKTTVESTGNDELLRIEKRKIVLVALFEIIGFGFAIPGLSLASYSLYLQGNFRSIIFLFFVVSFIYLSGDRMVSNYRKLLSTVIIIQPDRIEWFLKGKLFRSIQLDPSVEVRVEYSEPEKGFSIERITGYSFVDASGDYIIIWREWGWTAEDMRTLWNPFVRIIKENNLRMDKELQIISERNGLDPIEM